MKIAFFTKTLQGLTLEEAAETCADLGFDAIDLLVREGHFLEPGRPEEIARAVRVFGAAGLRTLLATIDATKPDNSAERLLAGCGEAGIGMVRLGFWRYDPSRRWREQVGEARRDLDGLERLAARHDVKVIIQLHGGTIHCSSSQAMQLLTGRDPAHVGAYPDPGNQVTQEGSENWRATLDILGPWLCCMGVKNGGWFAGPAKPGGQREWRSDWCALDEGMVRWDEIVPHLVATGFAGLFSLHAHYKIPRGQALDKARADLAHFRRLVGATGAKHG